jgi:hypothetical protein
MTTPPTGYTYDSPNLTHSPVTLHDLDELKASVLWSDADVAALAQAGKILIPQTDAILDVWYGFVGSQPHLIEAFAGDDGQPNPDYLAAVRKRFGMWIDDLCTRPYDQAWLDYQEEIGRRHHPEGKNRTDHVRSTSPHIPLRHLVAFIVPITATIKPFLANAETNADDLEAMHQAWFKAVTLTVALWARPYNTELW